MQRGAPRLDFGRRVVDCDGVDVEAFGCAPSGSGLARDSRPPAPSPIVASAHPVDVFGAGTAKLVADVLGAPAVCLNPRGRGSHADFGAFDAMVDRIEAARVGLGLPRWIFWGMSGGGWLALTYARRHPSALLGIVVESACLCFRARIADPRCLMSPRHDAWRAQLAPLGLLGAEAALDPSADGAWHEVAGIGAVYRVRGGPALVVAPAGTGAEMQAAIPDLLRFDARAWASSIDVPTLVIAGSDDPVAPRAHVRAIHDAIAHSDYVEVDGAGHVPLTERRPEVRAAFERFCARIGDA